MTEIIVIGIDGGKNGGIVLLDEDANILDKWIMPLNDEGDFNPRRIVEILTQIHMAYFRLKYSVYLEHAHPRPISGKRACFMNGYGYGMMIGILNTMGLSYTIVNPNTWMKEVLGSNRDKKVKGSIEWCKNKYPNESWTATNRSKKAHTGLTDACAIAYYGLQQEVKTI